jgi:hypothetical protein
MMIFRTAADLIEQFPWLNPREDWSNDYLEFDEAEEAWTELDDLPDGWKEGFLEEMLYEIDEVLNEYDCVEDYRVIKAENNNGLFKWEHAGYPIEAKEELDNIVKVYRKAANETCMECGMRAKAYLVDGEMVVVCELHKPHEDEIDVLP